MNNLNSFKRILICVTVLVCLLFVGYHSAFSFLKVSNERISMSENLLDLETKKQNDSFSAHSMIASVNADIERVNKSIVASDGDVAFIEHLEVMARAHKLEVAIDSLSLEDNPSLAKNNVSVLHIQMKTKGSWAGTYIFTREVESLQEELQLSKLDMQSNSGEWDALVEIRVLKYK